MNRRHTPKIQINVQHKPTPSTAEQKAEDQNLIAQYKEYQYSRGVENPHSPYNP